MGKKDSYRKIMPNYSMGQKTEIAVAAKLKSITDIDQLAMTYKGDIKIILCWKDGRISFIDLGPNGTYLNKHWKEQIWLPPLYFPNTVGKLSLSIDEGFTVKILKQGESELNDDSELNEGYMFKGDENELQLTSHYEYTFHCTFELSKFPFDTQHCNMTLKVPSEMGDYIKLEAKDLVFEADRQLNQFYLKDPIFNSTENGFKVHVGFSLHRNPSYLMINSFLPSLFTMLMTIVPLFLDDSVHFNTTIMLVLTAQLCLYTLMQSSLQDIPKTEYLKMIDYWNMFVMTVSLANFFILFLWEVLKQREIKSPMKWISRIVIPIITVTGFASYWIVAAAIYF